MTKSISFSGHRLNKMQSLIDSKEFSTEVQENFLEIIKSIIYIKINYYIDCGFNRFYIGMSDGIDLWVGEALMELKYAQYPNIEIVCVRPYSNHGNNFSNDDKKLYNDILHCATDTICLQCSNSKMAYYERNRYMVDHSNNLLAFVDDYQSGTGYTIKYAEKQHKPIDIVDLDYLKHSFSKCVRQNIPFYKVLAHYDIQPAVWQNEL